MWNKRFGSRLDPCFLLITVCGNKNIFVFEDLFLNTARIPMATNFGSNYSGNDCRCHLWSNWLPFQLQVGILATATYTSLPFVAKDVSLMVTHVDVAMSKLPVQSQFSWILWDWCAMWRENCVILYWIQEMSLRCLPKNFLVNHESQMSRVKHKTSVAHIEFCCHKLMPWACIKKHSLSVVRWLMILQKRHLMVWSHPCLGPSHRHAYRGRDILPLFLTI